MSTTLHVTGRPAQMGRGVLADVSAKLVERFAANLAEQLTADIARTRRLPQPPRRAVGAGRGGRLGAGRRCGGRSRRPRSGAAR